MTESDSKSYYFVFNDRSCTIEDLINASGISTSNFWFEYFLTMFSEIIVEVKDYPTLIKMVNEKEKIKAINKLSEFDIDGSTFDDKKIFFLSTNDKYLKNVCFKLIRSRKLKIIAIEELQCN